VCKKNKRQALSIEYNAIRTKRLCHSSLYIHVLWDIGELPYQNDCKLSLLSWPQKLVSHSTSCNSSSSFWHCLDTHIKNCLQHSILMWDPRLEFFCKLIIFSLASKKKTLANNKTVLAQPVLKNIPDGTRITKGKKITRIFICEHRGIFTNTNACIPEHWSSIGAVSQSEWHHYLV